MYKVLPTTVFNHIVRLAETTEMSIEEMASEIGSDHPEVKNPTSAVNTVINKYYGNWLHADDVQLYRGYGSAESNEERALMTECQAALNKFNQRIAECKANLTQENLLKQIDAQRDYDQAIKNAEGTVDDSIMFVYRNNLVQSIDNMNAILRTQVIEG